MKNLNNIFDWNFDAAIDFAFAQSGIYDS